ncbi:internal scaffolding protein [Peromfec virus RodF8_29]|uniref:Internal scaffolding protein n=1 Tax=Peromfec virus RodF8_29 TaxID=2929367 RepID=A0A976R8T0_9VIRU|nr:internal scaffolding protein [Peromfec virus RodF8_29]
MPANFATQFEPRPRVVQEPGDPVKDIYAPKFSDNGTMYLVRTGKHNLYAEIQSHAGSVDIHEILRRYVTGQDPGALSRVQGAYGDFTQMPRTFAEALNTMVAAEQYFLTLPLETRAEFNHDFRQFVAAFDTPDFVAKSGLFDVPAPNLDPANTPAPTTPFPASQAPSSAPAPLSPTQTSSIPPASSTPS